MPRKKSQRQKLIATRRVARFRDSIMRELEKAGYIVMENHEYHYSIFSDTSDVRVEYYPSTEMLVCDAVSSTVNALNLLAKLTEMEQ